MFLPFKAILQILTMFLWKDSEGEKNEDGKTA